MQWFYTFSRYAEGSTEDLSSSGIPFDTMNMEIDKQVWTFKADLHLNLLVVLSLSETKGQV